jgi:NTE family protein
MKIGGQQNGHRSVAKRVNHRYESVVLALQGGGALGAYQGGVYEGLAEAGLAPDWVVGVSIGAINAGLIAGNPPERRIARLREFWNRVSSGLSTTEPAALEPFQPLSRRMHVAGAILFGVPGFFAPRVLLPDLAPAGSPGALSYYDTEPLRKTLAELIDFDLLKQRAVRLTLGAVNVRSAQAVYFDNTRDEIGPDHIRASGALPPGFPPVEIDGEHYWDGGISCNSPVWQIIRESPKLNALILQADIFNPYGDFPKTMEQASERLKDIQYASKQLVSWERIEEQEELRASLRRVLEKLPAEVRKDPDVQRLAGASASPSVGWVRLVNSADARVSGYKDVDFSGRTVTELWNNGLRDVRRAIKGEVWKSAAKLGEGVHFVEATAVQS